MTELVKQVLGPRRGIREPIEESPLQEYITGVLAPATARKANSIEGDSELPAEDTMNTEEASDQDFGTPTMFSPALDPKSRSPSMGLSFVLESKTPELKVCITWARYFPGKNGDRVVWIRSPRHHILTWTSGSPSRVFLDSEGNQTLDLKKSELAFYGIVRPDSGSMMVSFYLVNVIPVEKDQILTAEEHIFQPQIRVVCGGGTRVVPGIRPPPKGDEEKTLEFLYRNRPVLAKGHLCSAVWRGIDSEAPPDGDVKIEFAACAKLPPFAWLDGEPLEAADRDVFSAPDVRTDFVPAYSIPSPDLGWDARYGPAPELAAVTLAELFEPDKLRSALTPVVDGYQQWLAGLRLEQKGFSSKERGISEPLIQSCETSLERMRAGIDLLCSSENARLAFCFANKALDTQSRWSPRRSGLKWYPFQLAFFLESLESIVNTNSEFRRTCDLLWVPTGGGKTEAYLAIAAFSMAYRRRRSLSKRTATSDATGAGVSVLTRYTLRLLAIQQFRRTVSLVTALEYLRVIGLADNRRIGWRPGSYGNNADFLWGTSQFTVGLWVGGTVTPNSLQGGRGYSGALDILKKEQDDKPGEPAQILKCPACDTTLAIPDMGLLPGKNTLFLVIQIPVKVDPKPAVAGLKAQSIFGIEVESAEIFPLSESYRILQIDICSTETIKSRTIDELWQGISKYLESKGLNAELQPVRASRPGYFIRRYINMQGRKNDIDFEIFCPSPHCDLRTSWCAGSPNGWISDSTADGYTPQNELGGIRAPDGNMFVQVIPTFRVKGDLVSERIPIPAMTVDEQLYHRIPSMVVSTVDKFARPPFEPRASAFFGNTDYHSSVWGYYRLFTHHNCDKNSGGHPVPSGRPPRKYHRSIQLLDPPDLILQDELHLIEGPLGSLVGMYETAIDALAEERTHYPAKYIASTATIRRAQEQVQAVFERDVQIFPPSGLVASDRFFVTDREIHPLSDGQPGRLYLGICAPGRGPLTPIVRIWSSLLSTAWEKRNVTGMDAFWTLTGYFNAVRELAGARALYRQDIPQRVNASSKDPRPLDDERGVELSGRMSSNDLPSILEMLNKSGP
ncbi:MAG: DISARM system helicase DrmA, partial [Nitrososphaerales archaeon]